MDFNRMILAAAGNSEKIEEITQAQLRHKHAAKLRRTLQCPGFRFPDQLAAEQATGDLLAGIHASLVGEGENVLDMTCGLGIDAFHIAGRAASVTACEVKPHVAEAARGNAAALGIGNLTVMNVDSARWLAESDRMFDTIFIDPARRDCSGGRLFALADCQPDVTALLPLLRSRCKRLVVKASPMLDVSRTVSELGGEADVMLLGTRGECKELVAIVPGEGCVRAVTVESEEAPAIEFSFTREEERSAAEPHYGVPAEGQILFEPFPAVMKSGGVRLLALRFGLEKIAPDTHLYFGSEATGFPGKAYRIELTAPFDKRGIRAMAEAARGGAEVAVRNMGGITAEELRRRLKIKENSDMRVYGVRDAAGKRHLILASKINA